MSLSVLGSIYNEILNTEINRLDLEQKIHKWREVFPITERTEWTKSSPMMSMLSWQCGAEVLFLVLQVVWVDKDCDIHIISGNGELLSWSRLERKTQKPQSQELEGQTSDAGGHLPGVEWGWHSSAHSTCLPPKEAICTCFPKEGWYRPVSFIFKKPELWNFMLSLLNSLNVYVKIWQCMWTTSLQT